MIQMHSTRFCKAHTAVLQFAHSAGASVVSVYFTKWFQSLFHRLSSKSHVFGVFPESILHLWCKQFINFFFNIISNIYMLSHLKAFLVLCVTTKPLTSSFKYIFAYTEPRLPHPYIKSFLVNTKRFDFRHTVLKTQFPHLFQLLTGKETEYLLGIYFYLETHCRGIGNKKIQTAVKKTARFTEVFPLP